MLSRMDARILKGGKGKITCLKLSEDNSRIVAGTESGALLIWEQDKDTHKF